MTVYYTLKKGQPLSPEQIAEIEEAKRRPIVYDEDSPALTPESIEGFRRSAAERNRRLRAEEAARRDTQNVS